MPFRILVPGHGMPQKDRAQIDRIISASRNVEVQVAPPTKQGLTLAEVQSKVNVNADATAFTGNDPWLRKWFASFWAEPIIASTYKVAKREPIVQSLRG
ncbi:MAG TPA: hypothetical protein VHY79_06770 [Rhizomicrobium sp.]|nr:hypothetical protein [Rhizomicrobium sp.]